ncbi:MAG: glycosyltransferase family 2 protein [Lentisphaerae bacterium]|nr:glycosyltransferase family 2 protein [Lentisphaerota bacterium]
MAVKFLAVVIPALNEAATIGDVIGRCLAVCRHSGFEATVLVVDDGSTDGTAAAARAAGARVLAHPQNRGVGRAFQTGLDAALESGADVIVNIDADGQFDPERIPDLIAPLLAGRADFVSASRFKDPALVPEMPRLKVWGNRFMSRLVGSIARQRFYDVSCGFRAYNREAALHLNLWGDFTYTQESFLELAIKSVRIEEVPMAIRGVRAAGRSRVASNLWRYGWRTLKIILHSYRDYWPLHFFGWISLPFMLLGLGLLTGFLLHRLLVGSFRPQLWMGFSGAGLLGLGVLILVTGVMGEMLKRIRLNQETLIYYQKKARFERP